VTPTLLARGTYDAFRVRSDQQGPIDLKAGARTRSDILVRRHDYESGSTTGWHRHPGPVFITVTLGTLTYYLYDDPTCTPYTVSAGQGFVDDGRGHVVRNETDQPAQDVSVITAPVGGPFRTERDAPNPYCGF
jgi:quercetin dioxygenase-like cupin family protein